MPTAPAPAGTPTTGLDTSASATTLTINKPTGTAVGDVLYAQCAVRASSATWTAPAGWTSVNVSAASSASMAVFQRIVDGTEGSSFAFTTSVAGRVAGGIVRVGGADPTTPVDVKSTNTSTSSTSLVATGVTPATLDTDSLLLAFYATSNGTGAITVPAGMTQLWSFVASAVTAAPDVAAAYLTLASNAATGNETATTTVAATYGAQLVIVQPPIPVTADVGWGIPI